MTKQGRRSRLQRSNRHRAWIAGLCESHAAGSKYRQKKWIQEHGKPPDKDAANKARIRVET